MNDIDQKILSTLQKLLNENQKIKAIKIYRDLYKVSLSDAKKDIETLEYRGSLELPELDDDMKNTLNSKMDIEGSLEKYEYKDEKEEQGNTSKIVPILLLIVAISIIVFIWSR